MIKVLLIGNYRPDAQESMLRFCAMLESGLVRLGCQVRVASPQPLLGRLPAPATGLRKWLGYVDKYCLFPFSLRRAAGWADIVHICDQSNAVYLDCVGSAPCLVTCHDLLAVRGALGEDTACPASALGTLLQKWILSRLKRAPVIACDSLNTKQDVERLTERSGHTRLIHVGLNFPYRAMPEPEAAAALKDVAGLDSDRPFVLHVGSNERRKNRPAVMRIYARLAGLLPGQLVFAGEPLTPELRRLAAELDLAGRVVEAVKPDNLVLQALYSRAFALLYPSLAEGFGWPVIEAQACGCPVVASDRPPLPEITGDSALLKDVADEEGFAAALRELLDAGRRAVWIEKGYDNAKRFDADGMIREYLALYKEILAGRPIPLT
ncbi:MAG TPA: glycosyltransferase family 1 protein [Candidatus Obscuribacterales bacterium]